MGSYRPRLPSPKDADGRTPSEPASIEASSVRMSPNMFSVTRTSKSVYRRSGRDRGSSRSEMRGSASHRYPGCSRRGENGRSERPRLLGVAGLSPNATLRSRQWACRSGRICDCRLFEAPLTLLPSHQYKCLSLQAFSVITSNWAREIPESDGAGHSGMSFGYSASGRARLVAGRGRAQRGRSLLLNVFKRK